VAKATIVFEPTNPPIPAGRVAQGLIENGSYTLSTGGKDDGALPGDYKVMVIATSVDTLELSKKTGGLLHQGDAEHQKAVKAATSPIPIKYSQTEKTPLKAKVEARPMTFDFPLDDN
jgi:hypothetical protein